MHAAYASLMTAMRAARLISPAKHEAFDTGAWQAFVAGNLALETPELFGKSRQHTHTGVQAKTLLAMLSSAEPK